MLKEDPELLRRYNPISHKNGRTFLSQRSSSWSPQFPDLYRLLLKEEWMLHSGKHGLVPTFKFTMSQYFWMFNLFSMFYCVWNIRLGLLHSVLICILCSVRVEHEEGSNLCMNHISWCKAGRRGMEQHPKYIEWCHLSTKQVRNCKFFNASRKMCAGFSASRSCYPECELILQWKLHRGHIHRNSCDLVHMPSFIQTQPTAVWTTLVLFSN